MEQEGLVWVLSKVQGTRRGGSAVIRDLVCLWCATNEITRNCCLLTIQTQGFSPNSISQLSFFLSHANPSSSMEQQHKANCAGVFAWLTVSHAPRWSQKKKKKNNQPVLWFQSSPSSLLQVQANIGILFMSRNWASHNPPVNLTDSSISQVGLASLCQTPELGCPKCGLNNSLSRGGLHFYHLPFPPSLLPGAQSWPDHISFFPIQFHMDLPYNLCCTEVFLLVSS